MGSMILPSVLTQQPGQAPVIDWGNPIARGLVCAYVCGYDAMGYGEDGRMTIPYIAGNGSVLGTQAVTPVGLAVKTASGSAGAFSIGQSSITTSAYSLFAVGTANASAMQSALDDDNGSTRRFQFRLASGKVEFIPFNSSNSVAADVIAPTALTASQLASGFTMGATASSTTAAIYQNRTKVSAAASGIAAPNTSISVGARKTSVQQWLNGGLSLVVIWNRTLTDAEMFSLSDNPWQLFRAAPRRMWLAYSAPSGIPGSLSSLLAGAALAASGQATDTGALASTLSGSTLAASGTVGNAPSGSIASTLTGAAMSAAGNVTAAGALASSLAGASMAASGIVTNRGAIASMLDGVTFAAAGTVSTNASGALATTLDGAALAAGGYVGTPPAGPDFFIRLPKNPRHVIHH